MICTSAAAVKLKVGGNCYTFTGHKVAYLARDGDRSERNTKKGNDKQLSS